MGLIRYILGGEGRKNLRRLDKMADKVLALEGKYAAMSDEELKSVTPALKERLAKGETLDDILYDAFAAVREAAWRVLNMRHYKVQVMGGIYVLKSKQKTQAPAMPSFGENEIIELWEAV